MTMHADCPVIRVIRTNIYIYYYYLLLFSLREDREKIKDFVESTVPRYGFRQFRRFFRMSPTTFEHVLQRIAQFPCMQQAHLALGRPRVTTENKLLMTLRYVGSQETINSLADRFGVAESTLLEHIKKTMRCLSSLPFIAFPSHHQQRNIMDQFEAIGFPNTVGAIDGSHIAMKAPAEDQMSYYNRKGFTSIVLQAVCTAKLVFTDIYTGWPGKVHDARVLRNSPLYAQGVRLCGNNHHLIGDSAYPLLEWLMTPYRDNGHLTQAERNYNKCHAKARCPIERAFALLKGRFPRLKYVDCNTIQAIVNVIECACYLHNICIYHADEVADMIDDMDQDDDDDDGVVPHNQQERNGDLKRTLITRQLHGTN